MVGRVARKMDDFCFEISDVKDLVVVEEMVESVFKLADWHAVFLSERLLDLSDPFADADGRLEALDTVQNLLEIRGRGQVVCVSVRFEDSNDVVALRFDR